MKRTLLIVFAGILALSCTKEAPRDPLMCDCLDRSWGIHMVGEEMNFAFAGAIHPGQGTLKAFKVVATIPGATGTGWDENTYKTNTAGVDEPTPAAKAIRQSDPCASKVNILLDTCALTLRYKYVIPEEARDKDVKFMFYASNDKGQVVCKEMGPVHCSRQDCVTNIQASNTRCYISVEDMAVYTYDEVIAGNKTVDIIYAYREVPTDSSPGGAGSTGGLNKCFMSPTAEAINRIKELRDVKLPPVERNTKLRESAHAKDEVIEKSKWHLYVTDQDFAAMDFARAGYSNLVTNFVTAYNCIWIETEDGKYRAWMWVNTPAGGGDSITFGMKRYAM